VLQNNDGAGLPSGTLDHAASWRMGRGARI